MTRRLCAARLVATLGAAFADVARADESPRALERELSPAVHEARSNISFVYSLRGDFGAGCDWAPKAKQNGDRP